MSRKKKKLTINKNSVVDYRKHLPKHERKSISSYMLVENYVDRTKPTIIFDPKDELFSEVE